MKLNSLIGKEILDIHVKIENYAEFPGLWKADCYFVLTDNLIIGLPFHIDETDVWIKELNPLAKSYYPPKKWWQKKQGSDKIKNAKIIDIIDYPDEIQPVFIELDSGLIITVEIVAPIGISAGLRVFDSVYELEKMHGKGYIRLTNFKVND